jgi:hypothetical protein
VKQPIEEAIRQLETELSLLKTRLPNRETKSTGAYPPAKPGGIARASKLRSSLASPSQKPPVKPNLEH